MLKFKHALIFFFAVLTGPVAICQTVLKGRVFEYNTHLGLSDISIQDVNSKEPAMTDNSGLFAIKVKVGDLLVFSGFAYKTDSVVVTNFNEKDIYLFPKQNMLSGVTINTANAGPGSFKVYDPDFHGQTVVYQRDANGNPKGGVAFKISDWTKDENKKKRQAKMEADDKVRDKIDTVFVPAKISKYVPLKGEELKDFIALYKPDVEIYISKDFNLLSYLNACYQEFIKLPAEKKHMAKLGG